MKLFPWVFLYKSKTLNSLISKHIKSIFVSSKSMRYQPWFDQLWFNNLPFFDDDKTLNQKSRFWFHMNVKLPLNICVITISSEEIGPLDLGHLPKLIFEKESPLIFFKMYWSSKIIFVITVSCSTWMTTKINGVAIDLFCTGVIGHLGCKLLN